LRAERNSRGSCVDDELMGKMTADGLLLTVAGTASSAGRRKQTQVWRSAALDEVIDERVELEPWIEPAVDQFIQLNVYGGKRTARVKCNGSAMQSVYVRAAVQRVFHHTALTPICKEAKKDEVDGSN
jgi:hypothetical protein